MENFPRISVNKWIKVFNEALDTAYRNPKMQAKLKQLNSQARSIRSWKTGNGDSAKNTDSPGWRLLR